MSLAAWISAARPKTLTAALVPIVIGSALGFKIAPDNFSVPISLIALISSVAIQIGTNLFNDVIDFERGADTRDRIGPKRITLAGEASIPRVYSAAWLCFLVALITGAVLVWHGGWPILVIGILSLLFGYCYTGGPFPLAYRGLGEIFVLIFFGLIAVSGTVYLQTGLWLNTAWLAGVQIGLLASALIAINNLRDITTDLPANKMTLAVRLGAYRTRILIASLILLPMLTGVFWLSQGQLWAFIFPLLPLPFGVWLAKAILEGAAGEILNQRLANTALLHLLFGICLALGLAIS
jgi:1,4-dihydroxy-2-naphthoate octaprenyltransferase